MKLTSLSVSDFSARGYIQETIPLSEIADRKEPSQQTADGITYVTPFGYTIELFYGGEFKISQLSSSEDVGDAKRLIVEELDLTIDEFEILSVSINGDVNIENDTSNVSTIASRLMDNPSVHNVEFGDNTSPGDIMFTVDGVRVLLFFSLEQYYISGISVQSAEELYETVSEKRDMVENCLNES